MYTHTQKKKISATFSISKSYFIMNIYLQAACIRNQYILPTSLYKKALFIKKKKTLEIKRHPNNILSLQMRDLAIYIYGLKRHIFNHTRAGRPTCLPPKGEKAVFAVQTCYNYFFTFLALFKRQEMFTCTALF